MTPTEMLAAVTKCLQAEPHVRWAYVFGSVARNSATFRDVDVAVMPSPTMPQGAVAWGALVARLENAVGTKVDLVDLTQDNLPFVGPLLTERKIVVDHEPTARSTWEAETTSRWLDFRPSYDEFLRVRNLAMQRRLAGK